MFEFSIVGRNIWLTIIEEGYQLAVMLKLIFKLGKFRYNLLPLFTLRLFYDICNRSMSIINGTSKNDGPSISCTDVRERCLVRGECRSYTPLAGQL